MIYVYMCIHCSTKLHLCRSNIYIYIYICLYIYKYLQIHIFYIYIYAYSSPFILLRLNLCAFAGMVLSSLCVIVADCGFTCQKRVCEKPFLSLAISAPLYININIIIRIKTYSFPKISPSGYKLMEF